MCAKPFGTKGEKVIFLRPCIDAPRTRQNLPKNTARTKEATGYESGSVSISCWLCWCCIAPPLLIQHVSEHRLGKYSSDRLS